MKSLINVIKEMTTIILVNIYNAYFIDKHWQSLYKYKVMLSI